MNPEGAEALETAGHGATSDFWLHVALRLREMVEGGPEYVAPAHDPKCPYCVTVQALQALQRRKAYADRVEEAACEAVALCDRNRPTGAGAVLRAALNGEGAS